ncbi:toprim domain-containing protein [uncultured Polaribacter sp.]|uniref:toprim domain-containing protein n=1 Tax=uncultured Polaribacter sp. TaxID=174711 RepID=UPI002601BD2C|nr:toprim domain-containing protein [uncultured Polaribacter sp.]
MQHKRIDCKIANKLDFILALKKLGFNPVRENESSAMYLSPFREERTASFKVSKQKNVWIDFGDRSGGTVVDFIMRLKSFSVTETLDFLSNDFSFFSFHPQILKEKKTSEKITIIKPDSIKHPALISYLKSRKIPINIALLFCKEVRYEFSGKLYFSIGLKNISGGWELRNKIFKNSSSPKNYTHIKNSSSVLIVVEGMFDLLSIITLNPTFINTKDLLILNSIYFLESAKLVFENYDKIELYLDRDDAGFNALKKCENKKKNIIDMSFKYKGFKDWNAFLLAQ